MQYSVRQFARRILALHLVLLALVLAVVFLASRQVYNSARQQALDQARQRQSLLANQTARGIENFYEAILSDLHLFRPADAEEGDPDPSATPAAAPNPNLLRPKALARSLPRRPLASARGTTLAGQLLAQQLQGRSHLFWIERRDEYIDAHPLDGSETTTFERDVIDRLQPWLESISRPTVSGFFKPYPDQPGMILVVAPLASGARWSSLLVAAVGVRPIQREFIEQLSAQGTTKAFLFDDTPTVMASSQPDLAGLKLDPANDPQLAPVRHAFNGSAGDGMTQVVGPFQVGSQSFASSLVTAESIHVLDKQWSLLVVSPLADVDAVVREVFRRALFWAAFVALSVTAILVSTATQLIRSRARLERVRHEMLQNELRQAREIQLAWLPDKTKLAAGGLDIASINRPANHISGDFYNFFELPDGRTALVIGDVTGHGISAAFLMATTQLLVRTTLPRVPDPAQCLEEVNRQLCVQVFNGQFVTMLVLVLDPTTGIVEVGTAGHPAPLVSDGSAFVPVPLEPNLVLGVDRTARYTTQHFSLDRGSSMLLYTDGVVEVENAAGKRLQLDGLRKVLGGPFPDAQSLMDAVLAGINHFRHGRELRDDLTLVAVQLQPQEQEAIKPIPTPVGVA